MELQEEKEFVSRCEKDLPKMLMVDCVNYKLDVGGLLGGGFRISYGEFDGKYFNWKNRPIDLFYHIVEILPNWECKVFEGEFQDFPIYKTNIDDVISDCLDKLKDWHKGLSSEPNEIVPKKAQVNKAIYLEDKDIKHLEWVYERMKSVHNENEYFDYMIRFREILEVLRQPNVIWEDVIKSGRFHQDWKNERNL